MAFPAVKITVGETVSDANDMGKIAFSAVLSFTVKVHAAADKKAAVSFVFAGCCHRSCSKQLHNMIIDNCVPFDNYELFCFSF